MTNRLVNSLKEAGVDKKYLGFCEVSNIENFIKLYSLDTALDLNLIDKKYVAYYHSCGVPEVAVGFNNEEEFQKACEFLIWYLKN